MATLVYCVAWRHAQLLAVRKRKKKDDARLGCCKMMPLFFWLADAEKFPHVDDDVEDFFF